ncbi:unnamed protein product [Cyclocybe aegerita]|uniref:RNase H type-1 domain-containing protein n=1 Tax=Cyclocybe aegerita TaxID=1973307 RepID=A0A8S0WZ13_CYCAE|nr:unnamed protein product [Cyclocybe aegerita]
MSPNSKALCEAYSNDEDRAGNPAFDAVQQDLHITVEEIAASYLLGPANILLAVMGISHAIISGSYALLVFFHGTFIPQDLDIYVPVQWIHILKAYIVERGWKKNDDHKDTAYDMASVLDILLFKHPQSNRTINVIISRTSSAIQPIVEFHSTLVMNYIASYGVVCLYPTLTLMGKGIIRVQTDKTPHPGDRLLDRYADRLHFDERNPTQDRRPYLDKLIAKARADPLTVLAATDGAVPQSNQYQAASAAIIYKGHHELKRTRYVSGRVTAPDAELNAISCAVRLAVKQANCQHIMVFTDSMGLAHRAVDPGVHSGQAFSLSVCCILQEWFEADDLRRITFVYIPSALRWDIHVLDSWGSTFQDPTYRGSEFLELQQPDRQLLQPLYLNGGPWLSTFGHSITEFARVCRCITGHAPIGVYYRRFKINEPHGCTCGAALQSCQHVLFRCHDRYSVHYPHFLGDIASFMKYNPMAFGFNQDPSGVG